MEPTMEPWALFLSINGSWKASGPCIHVAIIMVHDGDFMAHKSLSVAVNDYSKHYDGESIVEYHGS